ncbi:MAG TPA: diguanylate cyclase, partial [Usitatibacter sp.]|nr:diguanylate cyclase [Usitatibacter sp.]
EVPDRFLAILNEQHLPEGWIGVVFDRTGRIVARTQEHERFLGKPGADFLLREIARVPEGAVEGSTLEGVAVISAYSRSPATGWTVALGIPRAAIAQRVQQRTLLFAAGTAMILALGLALAWGIGGNIASAIRRLERPASELGRTEDIVVPPLGVREADEVGQALVRASQMIALAQHRAQHDPLTGLANRALLREIAAHAVETSKRDGTPLTLLFIDLDGFKQVNDTHGHDVGDKLLVAVAERLRADARSSDVIARVGGDEFVVMLNGADADMGAAIAFKLGEDLAKPYTIDSLTLDVRASIGSATYPQSGTTVHDLLKRADEAMYRVKQARRES